MKVWIGGNQVRVQQEDGERESNAIWEVEKGIWDSKRIQLSPQIMKMAQRLIKLWKIAHLNGTMRKLIENPDWNGKFFPDGIMRPDSEREQTAKKQLLGFLKGAQK
jgi:hypothetical protein